MKLSDICILCSFSFIIIIIIISLNYIYKFKTQELKSTYSDMIELSMEGSLNYINKDLSDVDINMLSDNNVEMASINKELVLENFLKLLNLNFNPNINNINYMSRYVPLFITIENDGIYTSIYDDGKRKWSEKIPYMIKLDNNYYKFKLQNNYENLKEDEYELKKSAICETIKRQFLLCNIDVNLPYDDTIFYNKISNKGIIAVIRGIPLVGLETYDVIKMKGYDIKKKAKYVINEESRYEKANITNLEGKVIFDTKSDAVKHGYKPVIY